MPTLKSFAAPVLVTISGVSMYVGAAIAVSLFGVFPPTVVAWMRVASAGVLMALVLRPRLAEWKNLSAVLYGVATAAMNMAFYEAIARLPMGLVVAIEFLGPICVAALTSRGVRDWIALVAAGCGVVLIAGVELSGNLAGLFCAFLAALLWAAYIVAGEKISHHESPFTAMAVGFTWAAIILSPVWLLADQGRNVLGLAVALGILSAIVPYGLDQVVLKLVNPGTFAVLMALLPLSAAAVGFLALGQRLTPTELAGVGLVIVAVIVKNRPRGA